MGCSKVLPTIINIVLYNSRFFNRQLYWFWYDVVSDKVFYWWNLLTFYYLSDTPPPSLSLSLFSWQPPDRFWTVENWDVRNGWQNVSRWTEAILLKSYRLKIFNYMVFWFCCCWCWCQRSQWTEIILCLTNGSCV